MHLAREIKLALSPVRITLISPTIIASFLPHVRVCISMVVHVYFRSGNLGALFLVMMSLSHSCLFLNGLRFLAFSHDMIEEPK